MSLSLARQSEMDASELTSRTHFEFYKRRIILKLHTSFKYIFSLSIKPDHSLQNKIENKIYFLQNAFCTE